MSERSNKQGVFQLVDTKDIQNLLINLKPTSFGDFFFFETATDQ